MSLIDLVEQLVLHPHSSHASPFFLGLMTEVQFPDFLQDTDAKVFVEQLLAKDPRDRPTFHQITNHPWLGDIEFDAAKLKLMKIPVDWVVLKHVQQESKAKPRSLRRASVASHQMMKTDLSLKEFIEHICGQLMEISSCEGEQAIARWMAVPSAKTMKLFRYWNYISDDALKLEINAARKAKPSSRRFMRRATTQ